MGIAAAAATALAEGKALSRFGEVAEQVAGKGIVNHRARRHRHNEILGGPAGHIIGAAVLPVGGDVASHMAKSLEGVEGGPDLEDDIAAAPAVAAVGAAAWDVLLAMEMHHAVAAFARANEYLCFVNEHVGWLVA